MEGNAFQINVAAVTLFSVLLCGWLHNELIWCSDMCLIGLRCHISCETFIDVLLCVGEPASCLSGVTSETLTTDSSDVKSTSLRKTVLVMSGGEGYVDFRLGPLNAGSLVFLVLT